MRLKAVIKFNLSEIKSSIVIFYCVIAAISVLFTFSYVSMSKNGIDGSVGGADTASVVFLFIVGLNSYKNNRLYLSTNGITRRMQFCGFILASVPVAAFMALVDTLISNILSGFINYNSMFYQTYDRSGIRADMSLSPLVNIFWSLALYLFAIVLGYFITTLYYRMSKLLKIIFSIGMPALLLVFIPAVDSSFNNGRFLNWINDIVLFMGGFKNGNNPLIAVAFNILASAVFVGLTYLLARRAPVKE